MLNSRARSPQDRGSADRYYGRQYNPHYILDSGETVNIDKMTEEQIAEYRQGYEEETDRKEWSYVNYYDTDEQ